MESQDVRKTYADVAKETCLGPDLADEGGEGRVTLCWRYIWVRELKAIIGVKKRDGFAVNLLAEAEKAWEEIIFFIADGRPFVEIRRRQVDGSTVNK